MLKQRLGRVSGSRNLPWPRPLLPAGTSASIFPRSPFTHLPVSRAICVACIASAGLRLSWRGSCCRGSGICLNFGVSSMATQREIWLSTLELDDRATRREIDQAYRQLVQVWHPDRFAHNPPLQLRAQERLKQLNEAHRGLSQTAYRSLSQTVVADTSHHWNSTEASEPAYKENSITVQCPRCSRAGRVSGSRLNTIAFIRCPHCGEIFRFGSRNDPKSDQNNGAGKASTDSRPGGSKAGSLAGWVVIVGVVVLLALAVWLSQPTTNG